MVASAAGPSFPPLARRRAAAWALGLLSLVLRPGAAEPRSDPAGAPAEPQPALSARFATWLEEVEPILLYAERQVFLGLSSDYQRDAFIQRFWRVRDPYPESARNELKERYERRVLQARESWGLDDDRARIYLVHGEPAGRVEVRCTTTHKPAEVWAYDGSELVNFRILLIFIEARDRKGARLWRPGQFGLDGDLRGARRCLQGDQLVRAASIIASEGTDYELRLNRMLAKPAPRSREWLDTFVSLTTDLPEDAEPLAAAVSFDFPGRHQSRTVARGMLRVPMPAATAGDFAGYRSYNFQLTGEVVRNQRLFENFRYKFAFPAEELDGGFIPLAFQRYLRPGSYSMILKLEDVNGQRFFRHEQALDVPQVAERYQAPESVDAESVELFAEAAAAMGGEETSIRIVPPRGPLVTGLVRIDTLAMGREIRRVRFLLDERQLLAKTRPPYNVEIDLGEFPRPRLLRVEALDEAGRVVAEDQRLINADSHRFRVRLREPRPGRSYARSLLARAELELPEGRSLERLEFYLNDKLLATLYQEPFVQPIALPPAEVLAYVRAVAYLPDGNSTEDLVFVNAPEHFERMDVQMVELYTTVLDNAGRPVQHLGREEFEVLEDDVPQEVLRFETVADLPIHVGILLDNSASMIEALGAARLAALRFFEQVLTPRDRAAVITFNRLPRLAVKLTNDLRLLGGGLAGLSAEGETALYDSIMFGLYYFTGVKGQRALLLLSDGRDETSRFSFDETLEYARRAGVTLYAVGLALDNAARGKLTRLADETGGRSFFIRSVDELQEIYDQIQSELRAQYLIAYQSSNTDTTEEFRTVQLKLARPGLTAKTLAGYYP